MNEAIKLAIEKGGYRNDGINSAWILNGAESWKFDIRVNGLNHQVFIKTKAVNQITNTFHNEQIGTNADLTSDPLFWQALSKALGWSEWICIDCGKPVIDKTSCQCGMSFQPRENTWIYYAHQYFDLLLIGGDTEKFWKELLNKSNDKE